MHTNTLTRAVNATSAVRPRIAAHTARQNPADIGRQQPQHTVPAVPDPSTGLVMPDPVALGTAAALRVTTLVR